MRAVNNRIYYRPPSETFHEFLMYFVYLTFGESWWRQQFKMPADSRHIVVNWHNAFCEFTRLHTRPSNLDADGVTFSSSPRGPITALLTLGYDLFCLTQAHTLPDSLVKRLRERRRFQSARYELAIAAVAVRSGFRIEFLDETERTENIASSSPTTAPSRPLSALRQKTEYVRERCMSPETSHMLRMLEV
jgi:hypothetical protein